MNFAGSMAAASATVGTDLFMGEIYQQSPNPRVLSGLAIAGSAAAVDTKLSLFVGTMKVGAMYNQRTGQPKVNEDMLDVGEIPIPPGEMLHLYVDDAPATNPINWIVEVME